MRAIRSLLASYFLASVVLGCGGAAPSTGDGGACPARCDRDEDCLQGSFCAGHVCQPKSLFCVGTEWSANDRGELDDCGLYNCDPATGLCRTTSESTDECAVGALFDGQTQCVLPCIETDGNGRCTKYGGFRDEVAPSFDTELSCKASCGHDSDCGGGMCWHGRCVARGNYCEVDPSFGHVSISVLAGAYDASGNLPRTREVCAGSYACDVVTGLCRTECIVTDHCQGVPCSTDTRTCATL